MSHGLQFFLSRPVNFRYKPLISKYCIHAHNLNHETGRFLNINRNDRICNVCNCDSVEDEYHFILECIGYKDIRMKYINPYYWRNPSVFKLIQLLSFRNIKEK